MPQEEASGLVFVDTPSPRQIGGPAQP